MWPEEHRVIATCVCVCIFILELVLTDLAIMTAMPPLPHHLCRAGEPPLHGPKRRKSPTRHEQMTMAVKIDTPPHRCQG